MKTNKLNLFLGSALGFLAICGLASCGGGGGSSTSTIAAVVPPSAPTPPPVTSAAPTVSSAPQVSVMESNSTSFYTLEASDPDGDPVTLSMVSSPDSAAFAFNTLTGQLSPASAFDYETPLDSNEDNIYNLTFEVSDDQGSTTQFSVTVTVEDIRDAFEFGLDPNGTPADNFELIDWRLDYPLNSQGELTGQQEAPSERELVGIETANPALGSISASGEGFEHPLYFRTGADGGLVMHAPVIGATTSSGARFTRTELREMLRRGDEIFVRIRTAQLNVRI